MGNVMPTVEAEGGFHLSLSVTRISAGDAFKGTERTACMFAFGESLSRRLRVTNDIDILAAQPMR